MRVLLTGGGSGGHIQPNIALSRKLKEIDPKVELFYIGKSSGMEREIITKEGIPFYGISAGKLRRYFSFKNIADIFFFGIGCIQSVFHIVKIKPSVVFSKGGYVTVPVVFAAAFLHKPIIIHESDVEPGLATKLAMKFANTVCISWEESKKYIPKNKNIILTGIPIRTDLLTGNKETGRSFLHLEKNFLPTVLITGGSQGAKAINDFIETNLATLLEKHNAIHVVGKGKSYSPTLPGPLKPRFAQLEYVSEHWNDILALSDVVIARAGSTTIAELEALSKPMILIPLPTSSSRGDQYDNAEAIKNRHPHSVVISEQDSLEIGTTLKNLDNLLSLKSTYTAKNTALELIAETLFNYKK